MALETVIDWDHLSVQEFDRIVEALAVRWYPTAEVRAINGRGGDRGRDIEVIQGDRRRVYQLKYFPQGFSSTWGKRRQQITRSMDTVVDDPPFQWHLVVPCTLTDAERDFVTREATKRGLNVGDVIDRAKLDSSLAAHADLVSFFNRGPELRRDAVLYNQERAPLLGGIPDLDKRVRALGRLGDSKDPHWAFDFQREGDRNVFWLRAKTPNAHLASPITAQLDVSFGTEHATLAENWQRSMNFGLTEPLVLPPEVVARWRVDGPEWCSVDLSRVDIELRPHRTDHISRPIELHLVDDQGVSRSSYAGESTNAYRGATGMTLDLRLTDALTMRILLPAEGGSQGNLEFQLHVDGARAADVREVAEFIRDLREGGVLQFRVDGHVLASMWVPPDQDAAHLSQVENMALLADDIDVVGRYTRQSIPYPSTITTTERITLRALRLAIEGRCVLVPWPRGLSAELADVDHTELRSYLTQPGCYVFRSDQPIDLLGRRLIINGHSVFHAKMAVENLDEILDAIDEGTAAGKNIRFQPPGREWLRMYIHGRPAPNYRLVPTPWGIPGLESLESEARGAELDDVA